MPEAVYYERDLIDESPGKGSFCFRKGAKAQRALRERKGEEENGVRKARFDLCGRAPLLLCSIPPEGGLILVLLR